MDTIAKNMKTHYEAAFTKFGPTSQGVDWGAKEENLRLRYDKMLAVLKDTHTRPTILDVGCGYGGLYQYASTKGIPLTYTGIDVAKNMIDWAHQNIPQATMINDDFMAHAFGPSELFDFVVCNGILTQKLTTNTDDMNIYARKLIKKMFDVARVGIAFNIMTTKVNFMVDNLFYKNPGEMLAWCIDEISPKVVIDHSYLYEYTVYIYK